jgi:hypothetical protein
MRLKILPLMILLLLTLTPTGYTQTPPGLPDGQGNAYGIGPTQRYPGSLVLELMEAAEAEIDAAVREAYAEGYKAASLRFMPELARQARRVAELNLDIEAHKKDGRNHWRNLAIACGLSLLGGMAAGIVMAGR